MTTEIAIDNQFIFREVEFEDDKFHAASFVAKYRRVTSLESLRDQLRLYCDALKQQLYGIINRDYKDFITIATKLDGVDLRAEHLRKPLVDLRLNLATLHDGMVSSMQTIEDKLRHREEVVTKRRILEATLSCMEKLDTAEEIVLNIHQQELSLFVPESSVMGGVTPKGNGLRRRALIKSFQKAKGNSAYAFLSRDVFDCSELERASHAAAQAQRFLAALSLSAGPGNVGMNQRLLEQRLHKLTEQLVQRIRSRLSAIFSAAMSASANADRSVEEAGSTVFPSRAFSHCLRALTALSRGEIAEEVVAETVTAPLAKPLLTQGKVDGNGGRGSYLGLQPALESLALQVMSALAMPLQACEEIYPPVPLISCDSTSSSGKCDNIDDNQPSQSIPNASVPIDLIIKGVWIPVTALLKEKFSGMFSVGIAGTLARCYTAVESFTLLLHKSDGSADRIDSIRRDFSTHPAVQEFHDQWKLDLYLQLRTQEISNRLDRVCELVGLHGLVTKVMEDVYTSKAETAFVPIAAVHPKTLSTSTPGNIHSVGTVAVSTHAGSLTATLSPSELTALRGLYLPATCQLHLPISEAFCIEIATCLHSSVALRALSAKFFALSVRLVMRLEAHAAVVAEVATPSFSKTNLAQLIQQHQHQATVSSGSTHAMSTPMKAPVPVPSSTPSTHTASQSSTATSSIDDLVLLALDMETLSDWIFTSFGPLAETALGIPLGTLSDSEESPLQLCLRHQQRCLIGTRVAVWGRVCAMLGADCKKGLTAVRAVAAKYRMTNKPAPDAPSPYVEMILQPFRVFLDRHKSLPESFTVTAEGVRWEAGVLEDVTAGYLMQVQALMETVKQMDSALQRRSKLRTAAAASTSINMADSDKIAVQLFLDVKAYGEAVDSLNKQGDSIPSFAALLAEIAPAEKLLLDRASVSPIP